MSSKIITPLKYLFQTIFILLVVLSGILPAHAQFIPEAPSEEQEQAEPQVRQDSLGRRSPRGSISGFLTAVADRNYERASRYFNFSGTAVDAENGDELAEMLEELLNQRGQILPYSWISEEASGRTDDNLEPNLEKVGTVTIEGETVDLLMEDVKDTEGEALWLFSSATVESIASVSTVEESAIAVERVLPKFLQDNEWGGVPVGQWLVALFLAAFAYLISWSIVSLIVLLIPKIWRKAQQEPTSGVIKAFALPVELYAAVLLFVYLTRETGMSIILRQRLSGITVIIGFVAFLILLWRLTEFIGTFSKRRMSSRGNISGVSVVLFLKRAAKIAIVIFGIIAILGTFGVDVTTGIAALGIGGLALALGAQKTIENFVGSVTLITDQPIRVGDFCKVGDTLGTVEKVGMRSTRIRTLDRTVVTIPNGEFSSSKIENYAHRDRFWYHPILGLRYETTPDQIRFLLVELRAVLYKHPKVASDSARVRFIKLNSDSIDLEVFSYILASNYDEFLEVQEDLLLRMMDIVNESGTGFAFPSQTLYFAKDHGLSTEKSRSAEEKVRHWKEKGEMPLPKFDPQKIKEIEDTLDYPPEGSCYRKDTGTGKIPGL
ncbi:mechanosensitive ion channel family protein [Salinimicrobium flavum]|uniref:Mechanosensitive ion channel family protein n=1 Tax=Salinimicrobium flavum TaxID=1737065 RepID=A0ABW5IU58_9FLAO